MLTLHEDRYERLRHDDDGRWHLDGAGVGWRHWRRVARHVPMRRVRAELHGTRVLRVCDGPRPAAVPPCGGSETQQSDAGGDGEHEDGEEDQWPRVLLVLAWKRRRRGRARGAARGPARRDGRSRDPLDAVVERARPDRDALVAPAAEPLERNRRSRERERV